MADEKKKPSRIFVRSSDPDKVGVWERDANHPNGEVFVSGKDAKEVAATPLVNQQLANGNLVRADAAAPSSAPKTAGTPQLESEEAKTAGRRARTDNP
jgi:hypothetical protein